MVLHVAGLAELAGGIDHHVHAENVPGHLRRPVDLYQARTKARIGQEIALQFVALGFFDLRAEQVVQDFRLADIGNGHHLDILAAGGELINLSAGLAESHNTHPDGLALCHTYSSLPGREAARCPALYGVAHGPTGQRLDLFPPPIIHQPGPDHP